MNPEGKEEAWVSPAHRLKPAKRHHHSLSHGEEEVFLAACAGISGFIPQRWVTGDSEAMMSSVARLNVAMEGQLAKYSTVVSVNCGLM